jgi:formamidopyrimidine-DNA glycosylase
LPELPEVETVRRGLEHTVVGRTVASVEVHHDRAVRRHAAGPADFSAALTGRTVLAARRRGKYLWLPLDSGDALVAHLGMSGQLVALGAEAPDGPHLRVRLRFTDGGLELRFVDQRTFGGMQLDPGGADLPHPLEHIALDPFDPLFDDARFVKALRARRTGVKRALLDQTVVSGVGNMYADEALWRARLHYERPTASLTSAAARALLVAVRAVMTEALAAGGTTFDGLYVNVNGQSGYFEVSLDAYGREGQPCHRCGTLIVREPFMNRSSFFCPRCQRRPRTNR